MLKDVDILYDLTLSFKWQSQSLFCCLASSWVGQKAYTVRMRNKQNNCRYNACHFDSVCVCLCACVRVCPCICLCFIWIYNSTQLTVELCYATAIHIHIHIHSASHCHASATVSSAATGTLTTPTPTLHAHHCGPWADIVPMFGVCLCWIINCILRHLKAIF